MKYTISVVQVTVILALLLSLCVIAYPLFDTVTDDVIKTLRTIAIAQQTFKFLTYVDQDNDDRGEYGTFLELTSKGVLDTSFTPESPFGCVSKSGYLYTIYLPGKEGQVCQEDGSNKPPVDPTLAEEMWCCIAWPETEKTNNTYAINQDGKILVCPTVPFLGIPGDDFRTFLADWQVK